MFIYNINTDYKLSSKLTSKHIREKTVKRPTTTIKLKKNKLTKGNKLFLESLGLKVK